MVKSERTEIKQGFSQHDAFYCLLPDLTSGIVLRPIEGLVILFNDDWHRGCGGHGRRHRDERLDHLLPLDDPLLLREVRPRLGGGRRLVGQWFLPSHLEFSLDITRVPGGRGLGNVVGYRFRLCFYICKVENRLVKIADYVNNYLGNKAVAGMVYDMAAQHRCCPFWPPGGAASFFSRSSCTLHAARCCCDTDQMPRE